MKVLNKLVLRNFFLNKKRTIVTIVGILLSTALITAIASMAESFRASMVEYEKKYSGDFHYAFYDVKQENRKYFEENRNIESLGYMYDVGYAALEGSTNPDKPYLYIYAMDESGMKAAGVDLIEGRLPQNDHEIIIPKHLWPNGGVSCKIGDKLSLGVGERIGVEENINKDNNVNENVYSSENNSKYTNEQESLNQGNPFMNEEEELQVNQTIEYTIVGIMKRPNRHIEPILAPGYTVITSLSDKNSIPVMDIYATYTTSAIKNRDKVTASLLGVSEDIYNRYNRGDADEEVFTQMEKIASSYTCNIWLLKWELMLFSDSTKSMLYGIAGIAILIVIVTSVFCIRNSFVISLTEKMKLYGMMSSIGATKKQRKRLVYGEALLLGCIGIPLGILCGTLATYIVVKCIGNLMITVLGVELVYVFSVPAVVAGVALAAVTLYFSAGKAAREAAKVSPIVAIRGNKMIRIRAKELRTPKIFNRLFGVGGAIAYKNLRRARVKYRTTVISIVVSVGVFIAMVTFTQLGFQASSIYYKDVPYQIQLSVYSEENFKEATRITQMDGVKQYEILRRGEMLVKVSDIPFTTQYLQYIPEIVKENSELSFMMASIGDAEYEAYCKKLGLSPDKVKDKGILIADYLSYEKGGKRATGMKYEYKSGDMIHGLTPKMLDDNDNNNSNWAANLGENKQVDIEIAIQTNERPMGLHDTNKTSVEGIIVVSDEWMKNHQCYAMPYELLNIYLQCDNPDEIQKNFENEASFARYNLNNLKQEYEENRSMIVLFSIFLYGFIIVISLVGITNIFNTITTNMELRSREFAMLKSIGMTKKEFRKMVWLESVFYGIKSLLIGIPIGIVLSVCFYKAFSEGMEMSYQLPYGGILIAIAAVFVLLFATTQYSMNKINRKNIVETIQNENI